MVIQFTGQLQQFNQAKRLRRYKQLPLSSAQHKRSAKPQYQSSPAGVSLWSEVLWHAALTSLPLEHSIGVLYNDLVHPGEGMGQQKLPLEKAHVTAVASQGEDHIGRLSWEHTQVLKVIRGGHGGLTKNSNSATTLKGEVQKNIIRSTLGPVLPPGCRVAKAQAVGRPGDQPEKSQE